MHTGRSLTGGTILLRFVMSRAGVLLRTPSSELLTTYVHKYIPYARGTGRHASGVNGPARHTGRSHHNHTKKGGGIRVAPRQSSSVLPGQKCSDSTRRNTPSNHVAPHRIPGEPPTSPAQVGTISKCAGFSRDVFLHHNRFWKKKRSSTRTVTAPGTEVHPWTSQAFR